MSLLLSDSRATIPHWPLPAVRALTRDGRLSTYDENVLKLSKVSFWGKCARMGHPLKLLSPTKLARLGHFPPASQAASLAGPVYCISFLWGLVFSVYKTVHLVSLHKPATALQRRHVHSPLRFSVVKSEQGGNPGGDVAIPANENYRGDNCDDDGRGMLQ
jgi:hypothetical protein